MKNTTDDLRAVDLPRSCSASALVTLLRAFAKEEREKSINSTSRAPKIMHAYAANRLEAVLLAVGASKHEPNEKAHPTAAGGTGGAQKGLWNMSKTSNGKEKRQLRVQRMVRSPVVLSQKQLREYVPGGGCRCAAWNESECACGVDWTPTEIYRLRLTIKSLRAKLRRMRTPNDKIHP